MDPKAKNRFIGSRAYEEKDQEIFFGRSIEAEELSRMISLNNFTILYGRSGLGKTSLLRAGVFPVLKAQNYLPVYLRLNFTDDSRDYIKQIEDRLMGKDPELKIDPAFRIEKINSKETLWEYFHRNPITLDDSDIPVKLLLIFDQFEEIFTLGTREKSGEFKSNVRSLLEFLSDLIENSPPRILPDEMRLKLQFRYASSPLPIKILFSFREEFLSNFYSLSSIIPSISYSNIQFRLLPLNYSKGYSIIKSASEGLFEETAIEETLRVVTESASVEEATLRDVDSFLLSVFCESQVNTLKTGERIKKEDILQVDIQALVNYLYLRIIDDLELNSDETRFIEERMINDEGYRLPVYLSMAEAIPNIRLDRIDNLVSSNVFKRYLLDGKACIEIIHDKYAAAVKRQRDFRVNAERENLKLQKIREEIEQNAEEEKDRLAKERMALELRRAEEEKRLADDRAIFAAKKLEDEKMNRKRSIKRLAIVVVVISLLAATAIFMFIRSQKNLNVATKQKERADKIAIKLVQANKQEGEQNQLLVKNYRLISSLLNATSIQNHNLDSLYDVATLEESYAKQMSDSALKHANESDRLSGKLADEMAMVKHLNEQLKDTILALHNQKVRTNNAGVIGQILATSRSLRYSKPSLSYLLIKAAHRIDSLNVQVNLLRDSISKQVGFFESGWWNGGISFFLTNGLFFVVSPTNQSIRIKDVRRNVSKLLSEESELSEVTPSMDCKWLAYRAGDELVLWSVGDGQITLSFRKKIDKADNFLVLTSYGNPVVALYQERRIVFLDGKGNSLGKIDLPVDANASDMWIDNSLICIPFVNGNLFYQTIDSVKHIYSKIIPRSATSTTLIPFSNRLVSIERDKIRLYDFRNILIDEITVSGLKSENYKISSVIGSLDGSKALIKLDRTKIVSMVKQAQQKMQQPANSELSSLPLPYIVIDLNKKTAFSFQDLPNAPGLKNNPTDDGYFTKEGKVYLHNDDKSTCIFNVLDDRLSWEGKIEVRADLSSYAQVDEDKYVLIMATESSSSSRPTKPVTLWIYGKASELDIRDKLPKLSEAELFMMTGIVR